MKRVMLGSLLALALFVPPAHAKGIKWVKVCGPAACNQVRGSDLDYAEHPLVFPPMMLSTLPSRPPQETAPWLSVTVNTGRRAHGIVESIVAPRIGYAGGDQEGEQYGWVWQKLDRAERRTYLHLGKDLGRFPAATMPGLD